MEARRPRAGTPAALASPPPSWTSSTLGALGSSKGPSPRAFVAASAASATASATVLTGTAPSECRVGHARAQRVGVDRQQARRAACLRCGPCSARARLRCGRASLRRASGTGRRVGARRSPRGRTPSARSTSSRLPSPRSRRARSPPTARGRCPASRSPGAARGRPARGAARRNRTALPARSAKCWASAAMSWRRSRSGGSRIVNTWMRYQRSSRNWRARTIAARSRCVAATTRTSTASARAPPTRSNTPSCSTRNSRTCAAAGSSPISSRNSVPPSARSNQPLRCADAPVKLPRSCPNSSESTSSGGIAPQLTRRIGPRARSAALVDRARDHFLARSGLAEDQHGARSARPARPGA